ISAAKAWFGLRAYTPCPQGRMPVFEAPRMREEYAMSHALRFLILPFTVLAAACGDSTHPGAIEQPGPVPDGGGATLKVLSNRPDLVNGGDALLELAASTGKSTYSVSLNGQDLAPA